MKTKHSIKVGPYRLTEKFAERALKFYSRHVSKKEMPVEVTQELVDGMFSPSVQAKSRFMVSDIAKLATGSTDERAMHAAWCAIADHFGLPAPAEPVWPVAPQPEEQEQPKQPGDKGEKEKGEGDESEKTDDADGDDAEKGESDKSDDAEGDGEGEGESEKQEAEESNAEGDGEGEDDAEKNPTEGTGEGEPTDEDSGAEDAEKGGDGDSDSDGEGDEQDGEGDANSDCDEQTAAEQGSSGGSDLSRDDGEEDEAADNSGEREPADLDTDAQMEELKNLPQREIPNAEPSPIKRNTKRAPHDWTKGFDFSRTNQLLARLREEIMSCSRHRRDHDKDSGDVDVYTKLTQIAVGRDLDRVYFRQTNARKINTAVQIFMDASGSMGGDYGAGPGSEHPMPTCCALTFILASALEKLRVPVEVLAFKSEGALLVKSWHERTSAMEMEIKTVLSSHGTHLPRAMKDGLKSLSTRRENRLIQLVITDGDIGFRPDAALAVERAKAIEYMKRSGHYSQEAIANQLQYLDSSHKEASIGALYKACPKLETYAFGVGVQIPKGVFDRAVSNLTPKNMVDVIVENLGRALVAA